MYFLVAVKRVRGMRLVGLVRREAQGAAQRRRWWPTAASAAREAETDARVNRRWSIYTDGACKGNPGPGGWGALLRSGEHEKELFGGELLTTNNRMELTA